MHYLGSSILKHSIPSFQPGRLEHTVKPEPPKTHAGKTIKWKCFIRQAQFHGCRDMHEILGIIPALVRGTVQQTCTIFAFVEMDNQTNRLGPRFQ